MIDPKTFLKFLKDRRTIRSYQQKSIPDEEIEMILEAGRWAPSASNRQEWKFAEKKAKNILNLDDNDFLLTILPFGYYKKKPQPPPKKELEDIVETI
jgi:predicted oxidoreductase (fatty acid repression mutant protein)